MQPVGRMKKWRIKKAEEEYSDSEMSSDDKFLAKSVAHERIKTAKSLSEENMALSREVDVLQ